MKPDTSWNKPDFVRKKVIVHDPDRPFGHLDDQQLADLETIVMDGFIIDDRKGRLNLKAAMDFMRKITTEKLRRLTVTKTVISGLEDPQND